MKVKIGIPYKKGKLLAKVKKEQELANPKPKRSRRKKVNDGEA